MHFKINYYENRGILHNRFNENISIKHYVDDARAEFIKKGEVDCLLIEQETGYSQLGTIANFLAQDLGLQQEKWSTDNSAENSENLPNIRKLADDARSNDPNVTLIGIASRRLHSSLKGLVIVPYQDSASHHKFALPLYGAPYRDFFYNVTYEGLKYGYSVLGARTFCLTHWSAGKYSNRFGFRKSISVCQAEAIRHFCNQYQGIKEIIFWDFGKGNHPLYELQRFNKELSEGFHRNIKTQIEKKFGCDFLKIDWTE